MTAFFRGLLLFLFGALFGAAGILFLTPSFQVDVRRGDTAIKPLDLGPRVAQPTPAPAPVAAAPAAPKPTAAAPVVAVKPAAPAAPAAPTSPAAEPPLDFAAISRHLILWPTAVTVKTPTTVAVNVEGQKPQGLALEVGTVLQLTRVLPDGKLEVRAKGAKFEIKSTSTDFAAELGKRVSELVAKGTKFDSPYPTAAPAVAAVPATPAPSAAPAAAAPGVVTPKRPLTLAERIDVLYGRKPAEPVEPVAPSVAAPSAPVPAPAAPAAASSSTPTPAAAAAAPATPAPAPASGEAAKVEEKGKDLDRKMNQLFK